MKIAYLEIIEDNLFFKIEDGDNILKGIVKYNDENELNLADDYYFSKDYGVYKKIDDENKEIFFLKSNDFGSLFEVVIDDNYINLSDSSYYPLFYYLDNNQLNFSSDYVFDNKNLFVEVISYNNDYFYRCFDESGKFVFLFVYYRSVSDHLGEFLDSFASSLFGVLGDYYSGLSDRLNDILYDIKSQLSDINCDIDFSSVLDKLDSISCDFSPLEQKLNEINGKFDILKVLDISKVIDEKLSQVFNLKSLNGSNGSKFKDGESVKVKGYNGEWIVDGSYPILNQDSISIIVYKLKQDDRIILAPAPFVEGV